ncbi:MAG: nucleotidyltransferase family protein [Oscillibacter sp.]|nr:nucleotidyltransferase family protein [Oscillibacter sp.]
MDNTLKIGCVVMAAGNAARFGENKLAAMVNGKPLIEHALEAIPRESFSRVLVVTQHKNVEAAAKKFGFETLRNEHPERGQSETIRLGTAALSDCDALCFMVADQPMLKRKTVAQELEFFRAHSKNIVGLGHNGVRGNPCLFPARFFPELLSLEGDVGGSAVIKRHLDDLLLFEASETELRDVDTKEALEALKKR